LIVLLQRQIDASRRDEEDWVTTILENLLVQFQIGGRPEPNFGANFSRRFLERSIHAY
jgi:hypothetical protein